MKPNDGIVVYRSEGERAFDQWMWNSGGGTVLLIIVIAIVLGILLLSAIDTLRRRRW